MIVSRFLFSRKILGTATFEFCNTIALQGGNGATSKSAQRPVEAGALVPLLPDYRTVAAYPNLSRPTRASLLARAAAKMLGWRR